MTSHNGIFIHIFFSYTSHQAKQRGRFSEDWWSIAWTPRLKNIQYQGLNIWDEAKTERLAISMIRPMNWTHI